MLINEALHSNKIRLIDKIRLIRQNDESAKYLDIHYIGTSGANDLEFKIMSNASYLNQTRIGKYYNFEKVEDAPADETVIDELDLTV